MGRGVTKQTVLVQDLPRVLTDALERLVAKGNETRPFVIVDYAPTARFLQYATMPETGQLVFDVPQMNLYARPCVDVRAGVVNAMMLVRSANGWALTDADSVTVTEHEDSEPLQKRLAKWFEELREKLGAAMTSPAGAQT
jgi:hypothetical protein